MSQDRPKLKVLYHPKDHPWRTDSGYSIPSRYLIQGLYKDIELGVFAPVGQRYKGEYYFPELGMFGIEPTFQLVLPSGEEIDAGPSIPIFPGISEGYGEDIVEQHFQHFHAEVLWFIGDAWALQRIPDLAKQDRMRWICQLPVDFLDPLPQYFVDRLSSAMRLVPWVKDGYDRLVKAGLKNVADPIPLPINCETWKPQERTKFPTTMRDLGFGYDTFNIAIVAANQFGRKAWDKALKGVKLFREQHPEVKVRMYIHTDFLRADGWDMETLNQHLGLADIVNKPDPYYMSTSNYTEYQIMLIHALADVVLNVGLEGFGHSTIQAQAVGTPIIGMNAGASADLVKSGILVPAYAETMTPNLLNQVEPHPIHIAAALEQIHETPRSNFAKGPAFVKENFDVPIVVEKWKKLFREVDDELERKCIKQVRYPPAPSQRALELATKVVEVA